VREVRVADRAGSGSELGQSQGRVEMWVEKGGGVWHVLRVAIMLEEGMGDGGRGRGGGEGTELCD
jgi:hypothetical protein